MRPRIAGLAAGLIILAAASPAVAANYYLAPDQTAVGEVYGYVTRAGDTLLDLARTYDMGFTQLMAANPGVDPWLPGVGRRIVMPGRYLVPDVPRRGIVINLAAQRLYYFPPKGDSVESFPIGVGVQGRRMPLGTSRVTGKSDHPIWYPPSSIRAEEPDLPAAVPPGPDNPLGEYALLLGWPRFLIHGTNKPDGVGRNVSHGCLHLYPEDMHRLFHEIPIGTPIRVIKDEVEAAWIDRQLFVVVHPNEAQSDELDVTGHLTPTLPPGLIAHVKKVAGNREDSVAWDAVRDAALERSGLPVPVTPPLDADALVTR